MTSDGPLKSDQKLIAGVPLLEIQQRAFQTLCRLVSFLDLKGIRYYLVGGTLLGAIRHSGFIPWDDDIDIVIPRSDYARLLNLLDQLPSTLRAIHPAINKETPFPYLVISDYNSTWELDYARPFDRGVGVDVFPLDGVPAPGIRRWVVFQIISLLRSMTMNKQRGYYSRRVALAQRLRFVMIGMAACMVPRRALFGLYDWFVSTCASSKAAYVGNLYGLYGQREVVGLHVFGEGRVVTFMGKGFRAPACSEEYLESVYGNYLEIPPLEKRHSGHRIRSASLF